MALNRSSIINFQNELWVGFINCVSLSFLLFKYSGVVYILEKCI